MCLMALALGQSSRWPLVLASNRDEFHDRPTLPLRRWTAPDGTLVISGRDLRAGGTWLGCTPGGRLALLTNVREGPAAAGPRSRGELPLQWLASAQGSAAFLSTVRASDYAGCNLLMGDSLSGEWTWASNRGALDGASLDGDSLSGAPGWQTKPLTSGFYGLSNALLDTPWPKTQALKAAMGEALAAAERQDSTTALAELQTHLWSALANRELAVPHELPDTGIDVALEQGLSSAWVDLPSRGYGTRCSTLVWLEAGQGQPLQLHIVEKTWTAGTTEPSIKTLDWTLA